MRTAILRFRDGGEPTVERHREIITRHGFVWWGWWKKTHEPMNVNLLEHLATKIHSDELYPVALIDRKAQQWFVGELSGIEFSTDGRAVPCPEPDACPAYYQASSLIPAWFKFERIQQISTATHVRQFGEVPSGDATIYEVSDERETLEVSPKPSWQLSPVQTHGEQVLHLSDLHFGDHHGFPAPSAEPLASAHRKPLSDLIADYIVSQSSIKVGVVVVSGDLITRGSDDFTPAHDFLEHLVNRLDLDRQHVVIVPGDHDIDLLREHSPRNYQHEKPFRDFIRSFYKSDLKDLECIRRFVTPEQWDWSFLCLNSNRLRSDKLKEYGYVSKHRYDGMLKYLLEELGGPPRHMQRRLVSAVLHHSVLPLYDVELLDERQPMSMALDAGEILDTLGEAGVQLVMHGHQHTPFIGRGPRFKRSIDRAERSGWTRASPLVLGCGGTGVARSLLRRQKANSFSVYTPTPGGLDVDLITYSASGLPRTSEHYSLDIS